MIADLDTLLTALYVELTDRISRCSREAEAVLVEFSGLPRCWRWPTGRPHRVAVLRRGGCAQLRIA
jgi:hypothetical protein